MKEMYYKVAEHVSALKGTSLDKQLQQLSQYELFVTEPVSEVCFSMGDRR